MVPKHDVTGVEAFYSRIGNNKYTVKTMKLLFERIIDKIKVYKNIQPVLAWPGGILRLYFDLVFH